MNSKKVQIIVLYRNQNYYGNEPTLERYNKLYIFDEDYLLVFLSSFVKQDIERVGVLEYEQ